MLEIEEVADEDGLDVFVLDRLLETEVVELEAVLETLLETEELTVEDALDVLVLDWLLILLDDPVEWELELVVGSALDVEDVLVLEVTGTDEDVLRWELEETLEEAEVDWIEVVALLLDEVRDWLLDELGHVSDEEVELLLEVLTWLLEDETGFVLELLTWLLEETLVAEVDGETLLDEEEILVDEDEEEILLDEDEVWLDEVT